MKSILIYTVPVLLVLITSFIWSDNLYNGLITAKQIWFYGAMALLILACGIGLLFRRKNVTFSLSTIDIALLTFYIYFFIRAAFTPYTPLLYNTRFLNYTLLLLFYFIVKYANSGSGSFKETGQVISSDETEKRGTVTSSEIMVIVLMLTGLVQAIWGLLQLYGMTRSFHSGFKITGTFFNPAPYALYLAAIFPLALGTLLQNKDLKNARIKELKIKECKNLKKSKIYSLILQFLHSLIPSLLIRKLGYYISLLTVISIILVLPATRNRASWLGVAAGSLIAINYRYNLLKKTKTILDNTARKLCAVAIIIILIGLSGVGLFYLKKGSSMGKLLIWEVTLGKITEKPLFGHGIGRFEAEYNNWQAGYFQNHPEEMDGTKGMAADNTKYCFNEYLEMAAELGFIGLLLFLAVIASIYLGIKARTMTTNDARSANETKPNDARSANDAAGIMTCEAQMTFLPSLVSLLICALISFPFYSLPTLIVFFLLLAILSSGVKAIPVSKRLISSSILRSFAKVSTLSTLSTLSVFLILTVRQQYKVYYTLDEAVMLYQTGSYEEASKSFSEVSGPLQYTGSYLQYNGKALNMNEEYLRSIEMLERATHFTSDEILFTTLGDTYKTLKRYSEAEKAYQHASFMVPHKLYPRYLLANLYRETGQKEKALRTAEEVLNKKIKVESTATYEIKQAMRELIEKMK